MFGTLSLLGQGPRSFRDPALGSPGSALACYWDAIQLNDPDAMWGCSVERRGDLPYPGMLWSFPATRSLRIEDLHYLPVDRDEVLVRYVVRFRPVGAEEERSMWMTTDLECIDGEWRVTRPFTENGLMNGHPLPMRVDS